jgi:MEDS: MEthanogen/methylotroph, DcmR Sensory domain
MEHLKKNGAEGAGAYAHTVQLYESDGCLATEISRVLCIAIDQAHGAIAIATPEHQRMIDQHLEKRGINVSEVRARGQYLAFDAAEVLSRFTVDGWPDRGRFGEVLDSIVKPMCSRFSRVSIFGEMVAILWASGKHDAAIRLEQFWNEIIEVHPVVLYCGYPHAASTDAAHVAAFRQVCLEHCKMLLAENSGEFRQDRHESQRRSAHI